MSKRYDIRQKRLVLRSMRRGIREMDLILQAYANANLAIMDASRLDLYEDFLAENDHDLYGWITGRSVPPPRYSHLVRDISEFVSSAGTVSSL